MNILFLNTTTFNPLSGGVERVTDTLTKELVKKGYNIFYLSLYSSNERQECYHFPTKMCIFPPDAFSLKQKQNFFHVFLIENKIDILVNQSAIYNSLDMYLPISKKLNVKIISVLHSSPQNARKPPTVKQILLTMTGIKCSFLYTIKSIIKIIISPFYNCRCNMLLKRHYKLLFENSDKICLLSERFYDELLDVYDYRKESNRNKLRAIGNVNTYETQYIDFSKKRKHILFVGRFSYAKQVDLLIKAWAKICQMNPEWDLVIVGFGATEQKLRRYVLRHKIERVRFEGKQDPRGYFVDASILCLTSSFEGWGLVLTEGMVYGCVPFSFDSYESVYDIIDHDENGVIVPKFNINEYAYQLNRVMNDDTLRLKMGKAASEKAKQFSKENILNKWERLFDEIINNKH